MQNSIEYNFGFYYCNNGIKYILLSKRLVCYIPCIEVSQLWTMRVKLLSYNFKCICSFKSQDFIIKVLKYFQQQAKQSQVFYKKRICTLAFVTYVVTTQFVIVRNLKMSHNNNYQISR